MLVNSSLDDARRRPQELLSTVVSRPEVVGDLADELTQVFYVLRNYARRWTSCDAHH